VLWEGADVRSVANQHLYTIPSYLLYQGLQPSLGSFDRKAGHIRDRVPLSRVLHQRKHHRRRHV
jgi:hypothetical protein